jgi:hypothetical protein
MNDNIILVTDCRDEQVNGINLLLKTLNIHDSELYNSWRILALIPNYINTESRRLIANNNLDLHMFPIPKSEDKYYIKLMLCRFLEEVSDDSQKLLYLDYDHLCFNKIKLPELSDDIIFVSSEYDKLSNVLFKDSGIDNYLFDIDNHFNTSLIYAYNFTLKKISKTWHYFYEKLFPFIPTRYLEEISFSLAAQEAGIRLQPISSTIQGNWKSNNPKCSIFHYGGEYKYANQIKAIIGKSNLNELNRLLQNKSRDVEFKILKKIVDTINNIESFNANE